MSEELWVVRAGEKAKYVGAFEANAYIAIGFSELAAASRRHARAPAGSDYTDATVGPFRRR